MRKKLIFVNIIVLVLLFTIYIFGIYFINYPIQFNFWELAKLSQLQYLFLALAFTALISWMISTLGIRNLTPLNKFLLVFSIINGLLFSYLAIESGRTFIINKQAIIQVENQYINRAKEDIKNNRVIYKSANGIAIPLYDEKTRHNIDIIRKKYGISYQNTGCNVDNIAIKGEEKYKETVQPYLDKRNGKGWEERMEKEIENLDKTPSKWMDEH